ncbi:MAG: T9SS type A sorting domain-containing protein [Flavobacteriales bacterium]|nr:T9SS type A sorting domain-containing protein [Flavobacteriales bacterium]
MRLAFVISAIIVFLASAVKAQDPAHEILDLFELRQVNNTIQIDFAVKGGASCQGVQLERSASKAGEFETVAQIQGICGGSEFTEYYTLVDEEPLEYSTNFYRLVLGAQGKSSIRSINFVRLENDYRVFPLPAKSWAVLKFENPTERLYQLSVYSLSGNLVEEAQVTSQEVFIDLSFYSKGTYIFQLSSPDENTITGKFIVGE